MFVVSCGRKDKKNNFFFVIAWAVNQIDIPDALLKTYDPDIYAKSKGRHGEKNNQNSEPAVHNCI